MQADLGLCWSHIPHCWKSHVAAHINYIETMTPDIYSIKSSVDPDKLTSVVVFSDKLKLKLFETKDIPKQHAIVLKVDSLDFKNSSFQATPNEAYSLVIPAEGNITISGSDKAGVFYGSQSLISLIKDNQLNVGTIEDWPRYPYRGMHMDVSRNFHTKEQILKLLDVMAMYKMNKLHFHLTDDEGWRLEIPGLPELTEV